ncbi:hypothetical protein NCCP2716_01120 [Sporosarcina sp. NCCP-2716]|uniref:tetratricopeptide repeat protein n=1 Tax=Sporosarcina sp. NCCP-2716 TaxID=2943679 RepID=UPI0020401163|nr:hypothetical protein [Sporosarcina sp. NCCP-2716]GKV67614.1 hypothetical protein NCCP2716_01120 [Sporosarcina sp. NCCP-2716]
MTNNILSPVKENFATKFYFGRVIDEFTFTQLITEFCEEGYETNKSHSNPLSDHFILKMISNREKKAIEISPNSISFFPILEDENEIEDIRKKIFKHVAKRYEVYNITSRENLTSSITSLLKNDLRSCASLLYYSFHKYTNTLLYNYYNKELKMTDNEIIFDEIEHYTSSMFYKFTEEIKKNDEIDLEKSSELLERLTHHSSKKNIDPFMLLKYTWKIEEKSNSFLTPNIIYLSNYLFKVDYTAKDSVDAYKKIFEDLSREDTSQEINVKKAIAFSFIMSLEKDSEKEIWMLYVIALRLYWLRQTADYEFDFDVNTSVKEMAKMVHSIKSLIELNQEEVDTIVDDFIPLQKSSLNDEIVEETESKEGAISCPLYSVDYKFPKYIIKEEREKNVTLFMSVIHLDSEFDKDKILGALNFTPHITNKSDCFIYEVSNKDISVFLYIHFSSEGRWLFWFQNDAVSINTYSEKDLKNACEDFFTSLSESYKDFHTVKLDTNLVGTNPIHLNEKSSFIEIDGLNMLEFELAKRKLHFKKQLNRILESMLFIDEEGKLFGAIEFDFDIEFGLELTIPFNRKISSILDKQLPMVYVKFIITDDDDLTNDEFDFILSGLNTESKSINLINIFMSSHEIQNFIFEEKSLKVKSAIVNIVNNISYGEISEGLGKIEGINNVLEKCIELDPTNSIPNATLGYWYFRNQGDLENGKKYYEEAIEKDENFNSGMYVSQLQQKYYYELAKYYCEVEIDKQQALYFITQGLDKDLRFQEEYQELIVNNGLELVSDKSIAASEEEPTLEKDI